MNEIKRVEYENAMESLMSKKEYNLALEQITCGVEHLTLAIGKKTSGIVHFLKSCFETINEIIYLDEEYIKALNSANVPGKIKHLSQHSKKCRVRKKNKKRAIEIYKEYEKKG